MFEGASAPGAVQSTDKAISNAVLACPAHPARRAASLESSREDLVGHESNREGGKDAIEACSPRLCAPISDPRLVSSVSAVLIFALRSLDRAEMADHRLVTYAVVCYKSPLSVTKRSTYSSNYASIVFTKCTNSGIVIRSAILYVAALALFDLWLSDLATYYALIQLTTHGF
jgi:hypothetical protein